MSERCLIYVAGPLYTPGERSYLEQVCRICESCGFRTYLPHRDAGVAPADGSVTEPFFEQDKRALDECQIVVAVLNGADVDSGTAWEMGYAYARGAALVGIYEDTRKWDVNAAFNLMLTCSSTMIASKRSLRRELVRMRDGFGKL